MHELKLLTYNVMFNRAIKDIPAILESDAPDIVCLQEVFMDRSMYYPDYRTAATSASFYKVGKTYGLATLYRPDKIRFVSSKSITLPQSIYEAFVSLFNGSAPRTALRTDFILNGSGKEVSIYNLHLTHVVATNNVRVKQLRETFDDLDFKKGQGIVVAGDLNFPFRKKSLEEIIQEYDLLEATTEVMDTTKVPFRSLPMFNVKLDFVFYSGLEHTETHKLEGHKLSDHAPLLSKFSF